MVLEQVLARSASISYSPSVVENTFIPYQAIVCVCTLISENHYLDVLVYFIIDRGSKEDCLYLELTCVFVLHILK